MRSEKSRGSLFLWQFVRAWKYRIALSLLALAFVSFASLLYPWLLKLMVDQFSGHTPTSLSIDMLCSILFLTFVASTFLGYYQQVEMKVLGFRLRNAFRIAFYDSLLSRSLGFYRSAQVGELSSRATEDIGKLQGLFSNLLSPAFQNALFISGCIILMIKLNWIATILVLGLVAIPIPVVLLLSRKIREYTGQSQSDHAHANAFLEESLVAMREIKSLVRERLESRRYAGLLNHAFMTEVKASTLSVKINQVVYFLTSFALLGIFYTGTRRSLFSKWTLGDVIAFYFYSYTMTMALLSTGRTYLTYQELTGALGRVLELLPAPGPVIEAPPEQYANAVRGAIAIHDVSFSYDGIKPVLSDLSLTIHGGEWHLITGPSGSGKSTLAGLIMGFYHSSRGSIFVDDVPLDCWDMTALRSQIGYVGQDPMLIHGTLRDNIARPDFPAPEEQILRALEVSCLGDVIRTLPNGLDTLVGERGYTLSGGQKARVAIARAIIHDPPILVLDEANAMLEDVLEERLWNNLVKARAQRTTIIFSHRYKNVPEFCKILLLRHGKLTHLNSIGVTSHSPLHPHVLT